jgi:hypothetical protein
MRWRRMAGTAKGAEPLIKCILQGLTHAILEAGATCQAASHEG